LPGTELVGEAPDSFSLGLELVGEDSDPLSPEIQLVDESPDPVSRGDELVGEYSETKLEAIDEGRSLAAAPVS
jgi:hypothetical protein